MNGTLGGAGRTEVRRPGPGLGVPCSEAQCDGVPCPEVKVDCAECERAHPAEALAAQQSGKPGDADA